MLSDSSKWKSASGFQIIDVSHAVIEHITKKETYYYSLSLYKTLPPNKQSSIHIACCFLAQNSRKTYYCETGDYPNAALP